MGNMIGREAGGRLGKKAEESREVVNLLRGRLWLTHTLARVTSECYTNIRRKEPPEVQEMLYNIFKHRCVLWWRIVKVGPPACDEIHKRNIRVDSSYPCELLTANARSSGLR